MRRGVGQINGEQNRYVFGLSRVNRDGSMQYVIYHRCVVLLLIALVHLHVYTSTLRLVYSQVTTEGVSKLTPVAASAVT